VASRGRRSRQLGRNYPGRPPGWQRTVGTMNIEVAVPDDWTVGQPFAVQQLLQHAVRDAQPVITIVRKDITVEQLQDIYCSIEGVIREAGLEVPAPAPSS